MYAPKARRDGLIPSHRPVAIYIASAYSSIIWNVYPMEDFFQHVKYIDFLFWCMPLLYAYTCRDLRRVLPANCFQNNGNIQITVALCCMLELIFLIIFIPLFRGLIPYAFLIYLLVKIKICLYNSCSSLPPPWREVGCLFYGRKSVLLRGTKSNTFFLTKVFIYNWHAS